MSLKYTQTQKNDSDINKTVLTNIILMMTERNLINKSNANNVIKKLIDTKTNSMVYKVELDHPKEKLIIKILSVKVTSVGKKSETINFLNKYKGRRKLLVVKSINAKTRKKIVIEHDNTEIFLEEELMHNLIDHELVPNHIVLSDDEADAMCVEYKCKKHELPKLFDTDPVARYYNMKLGDVCKIMRNSLTTGVSLSYRLVVAEY